MFLLRGDDPVLAVLASIPLTAVLTPALTRKFHHDRCRPESYHHPLEKQRYFYRIFLLKRVFAPQLATTADVIAPLPGKALPS
ncbi:hypothetical protein [Sphingomonas sp. Root710]|uniref:hypothetical protein n=1 Tax=Sphingomonas sp. Root710 TaxID=1736594 RepID=UPI0012E3BE22|nr:hypothetical protein [Sphingomonas sp. Root710]